MTKIKMLNVFLEGIHLGVLQEDLFGNHTFTYDLSSPSNAQLSLSMPRRAAPWKGIAVEAYIDGILPDDPAVRQRIARLHGVNARNPFSLLTAVGLDCGGGVQFIPEKSDSLITETITPISKEQIGQRLEKITGEQPPSWQSPDEHWSLNGAHDKLAVRFTNGQWYEAEGKAATTHIIKPGVSSLHEQAFNEYICLNTAKKLGIPVAQSDYCLFGGIPAIVSERWDRIVDNSVAPAIVKRIHQEDLCQAMSVTTDQKYESEGGPGATDIVHFMRDNGLPEDSVHLFFKALVFNYIIAGGDAHAKNYAILEPIDGTPHLAPLYDIASYFAYDTQRKERKLAMRIGGEYSWERIDLRHWHRFAEACTGQSDWETLGNILLEYALSTLPAFLQVSEEALALAQQLEQSATGEQTANKFELIMRIRDGIAAQSTRILSWFATANGGNAHYCYSRFL